METILITGGLGFIGSHTVVQLIEQGFEVLILDNLSNSSELVLPRIKQITGTEPRLIKGNILDAAILNDIFTQQSISAVVHFAGLKAVGESVEQPLRYYQNNVAGTLNLLEAMLKHNCFKFVFSSSATVYGDPASVPITEEFSLSATNPYGQSKLMVENILRDISQSDERWQISILRYFNPVAAHPSGLIGEDPNGVPNNLMPFLAQVAVGKRDELAVFGDDYDTPDGTGVRDYIHVVDLANAHLKALQHLSASHACCEYNIGTGNGYSVLEMVTALEQVCGKKIKYAVKPRRAGDIAKCYANVSFAEQTLGWQAKYSLDEMMQDQWRWQSNNPNGYSE